MACPVSGIIMPAPPAIGRSMNDELRDINHPFHADKIDPSRDIGRCVIVGVISGRHATASMLASHALDNPVMPRSERCS